MNDIRKLSSNEKIVIWIQFFDSYGKTNISSDSIIYNIIPVSVETSVTEKRGKFGRKEDLLRDLLKIVYNRNVQSLSITDGSSQISISAVQWYCNTAKTGKSLPEIISQRQWQTHD